MPLSSFDDVRAQYLDAVRKFRPARAHAIPDLVLLGFLNEIEENAQVTSRIGASDLPHRGFANARSAFEAAQLALLLGTDPDYDRAGARAWVYYLRKDRLLIERNPEEFQTREGLTPAQWFTAAINEIATLWNDLNSGKGQLLLDAVPVVESQPKRPDNWTGLPIAPTLRDRLSQQATRRGLPVPADASIAYNNAYAALSRESHPRTRLRPATVRGRSDGYVDFDFEKRDTTSDADTALTLATGALAQGYAALGIRVNSHAV